VGTFVVVGDDTVEVGVLVFGFVVLGLDDVLIDVGRRVLGLDVGR